MFPVSFDCKNFELHFILNASLGFSEERKRYSNILKSLDHGNMLGAINLGKKIDFPYLHRQIATSLAYYKLDSATNKNSTGAKIFDKIYNLLITSLWSCKSCFRRYEQVSSNLITCVAWKMDLWNVLL